MQRELAATKRVQNSRGKGKANGSKKKISKKRSLLRKASSPASSRREVPSSSLDPIMTKEGEPSDSDAEDHDGPTHSEPEPRPKGKAAAKKMASPKAKATAKAVAKAKAKAKAKASAKAKAKPAEKPEPKAPKKCKGKAQTDEQDDSAPPPRKRGRPSKNAEADDGWEYVPQRRVCLGGRKWIYEIVESQVLGCSNCRFIFHGCKSCAAPGFAGKSAQQMAEDTQYSAMLAALNEKENGAGDE